MSFDLDAARRYGDRELRPEDSYHAEDLLAARTEIERLRGVLGQIADTHWMGEDRDGNDKAATAMRDLAVEALALEVDVPDFSITEINPQDAI